MKSLSYFLLFGLSLFSCIDDKDYSFSSIDVKPTITIPLTNGSVSIRDFLNDKDSSYFKADKDGLLSLVYSENLSSQDIRGLFSIPDVRIDNTIKLSGITLPQVPKDIRLDSITTQVDLQLSPEQLSEISFSAGQLSFTTSLIPSSNLNYELIASLPDFVSKTTNQPLTIQGKGPVSIQLSNYIVKLNKNKFTLKIVFVLKRTTSAVTIGANANATYQVSLLGMNFGYIKGFFGDQTTDIPASTLDIGAFGNSLNKASISFSQPQINFVVTSDYGVPVTVNYKIFEARKNGAVPVPISLNPINPVLLNSPTTLGTSATTSIAVTNTNQVINYAPTQFYYQASVNINKGLSGGNNFLADTSKLRVRLNVSIPLQAKASGITLADTVSVDLSDVNQSQIEEATLKVKITNQIPLDGTIQFYLADKNYVILDQLLTSDQTSLIKGSSVDATGDLKTAGLSDQSLALDKTKLNKLFSAKYIILSAIMSTSKDATGNFVDVKFKTQYKMTVETGISAKLNLNVKI
jgi:hypothetical protein